VSAGARFPPTPVPSPPGEGPTPPLHPAPLGAGQVTRKLGIHAGNLRGVESVASVVAAAAAASQRAATAAAVAAAAAAAAASQRAATAGLFLTIWAARESARFVEKPCRYWVRFSSAILLDRLVE
jgi:hypothetical protein